FSYERLAHLAQFPSRIKSPSCSVAHPPQKSPRPRDAGIERGRSPSLLARFLHQSGTRTIGTLIKRSEVSTMNQPDPIDLGAQTGFAALRAGTFGTVGPLSGT